MHLIPLLSKQLKSDDIVDVLEMYDMKVDYEFDKTHENLPDRYWAACRERGFQFGFDTNQVLETIFLYLTPEDGFTAFDIVNSDIIFFPDQEEVVRSGKQNGVSTVEGSGELAAVVRDWARLDYPRHSVHYEFRGGQLALITIQKRDET